MRHYNRKNSITKFKWRRGMSFIEILSALVIVALLCGIVISSIAVISDQTNDTVCYTRLKVYAIDLIEDIRTDLNDYDAGLPDLQPIDSTNYNDDGRGNGGLTDKSGIEAKVTVTSIGNNPEADFYNTLLVYGKELYLVEYTLKDLSTHQFIRGQTLLRGGCTANAD